MSRASLAVRRFCWAWSAVMTGVTTERGSGHPELRSGAPSTSTADSWPETAGFPRPPPKRWPCSSSRA